VELYEFIEPANRIVSAHILSVHVVMFHSATLARAHLDRGQLWRMPLYICPVIPRPGQDPVAESARPLEAARRCRER
jgi:hypothetical protein